MAVFWAFLDKPLGLPPILPLARAALSPAKVRSRMISLSNSATDANILKINLPWAVLVSIGSQRLFKPTCLSINRPTSSTKCFNDLPSRSSFHITSKSPSRRWSNNSPSCFLLVLEPHPLLLVYLQFSFDSQLTFMKVVTLLHNILQPPGQQTLPHILIFMKKKGNGSFTVIVPIK